MPDRNPIKYDAGQHRPFVPGDTLPPPVLALPQRVRAGTGIQIVDNGDGTLTIVNTCCDTQPPNGSVHTLTMTPVQGNIIEGQDACWNLVLNAPVADAPLTIAFTLSGDEQAVHAYPVPSTTIPIGSNRATVCVPTIDDTTDEPNRQLILAPVFGLRLTGWTPPGNQVTTILVIDNDGGSSGYNVLSITPVTDPIVEGDFACWDVELDRVVTDNPLPITLVLGGDEQAQHQYTEPFLLVALGHQRETICVATTDDATVEPDRSLTLTAMPGPRVTSVPGPSAIVVRDNDSGPPTFGQDFANVGGLCCVTQGGSGVTVSFGLHFAPDGSMRQSTSCGINQNFPSGWVRGAFNPADYEIEVSLASQQGDIGGQDVWINLGTARSFVYTYTLTASSGGRFIFTRLTIRRASDQQIMVGPHQVETVQLGVNTECV